MRKMQLNEKFFDNIDSEEKAYLLGFFLADGCISHNNNWYSNSNSLTITLTEEDSYVIEWFKQFIAYSYKISTFHNKKGAVNRKPVKRIKWSSKYMSSVLQNEYSILPNKTKDLFFKFPFEKIQKEYLFDFIRGFFDGDGNISFYENKKYFNFGFYSTSEYFLNQLGSIFKKEFKCNFKVDITKKNNKVILYYLRFNLGNNLTKYELFKKIYNKFYKEKKFFLLRKKSKLELYLNTVLNKETNKSLSV
jgi:hypothetical protein